jgi:hypothetical protein
MPVGGFPTQTGSIPLTLSEGLAAGRSISTQLKNEIANSWLPGAQTSGLSALTVLGIPQTLINWMATLNAAAALNGMAAYAQAQLNNDTNVSTQFSTLVTAMQAVVSWINANFPAANGYLEYAQLNSSTGAVSYTTFTTAQLAGLVTVLESLQAALD